MPSAFSPRALRVDLPPGHRFPMDKYDRVAQRLEATDWTVLHAPDVEDEALTLTHDRDYLDAVAGCALDARAERRLGFPQSPALVARSRASVGGTVAAARTALDAGLGVQLAGGTHHAFRDRGEGFCVYNDLVVAARTLLAEGAVRCVLVIDLDVHQGNGTAALCADDPRIATYSMHGDRNYPFVKERSDLDVPLPDGTGDVDYLAALDASLPAFARAVRPDLVLYQGGVDVLAGDRFGRLALSLDGVVERDRRVAAWCRDAGIPLVTTLGGGYHADVDATVAAHVAGLMVVAETLGV